MKSLRRFLITPCECRNSLDTLDSSISLPNHASETVRSKREHISCLTFLVRNNYLYQIQTTLVDAVYIGNITGSSVDLNASAIAFADGKVPVSRRIALNHA